MKINFIMELLDKKLTIIILSLFSFHHGAMASYFELEFIDSSSQKKETILLVDVAQPLLFGKVGIGLGRRNLKHENVFYGNYIFGPGAIPTTAFAFMDSEGYYSRTGFDVGVQLKTRNKLLSKPYKEYIKDHAKRSRAYSGTWFELSYKFGKRPLMEVDGQVFTASSYQGFDLKFGGMLGWSFDNPKSKLFFDLNIGLGIGRGWWKVDDDAYTINDAYGTYFPAYSYKVNSFLLLYKLGFQLGFKL